MLSEASDSYWPNLGQGDAVHEFCPECLKQTPDTENRRGQDANASQAEAGTAGGHSRLPKMGTHNSRRPD